MSRLFRFALAFGRLGIACLCPAGSLQSARADCTLSKTGNVPLPDLGPGLYRGFMGGLYPGGSNVVPPAHAAAGLVAASQIEPLNASGEPDPVNGRIVLTSIGMSSVTQEWLTDGPTAFLPRAVADATINPRLTFVDGAEGGKDAPLWSDPDDDVWINFQNQLQTAGVTREQVQVAWFEEAIARPVLVGGFPKHAQQLQVYLEAILRNLKAVCPNLRIVYLSTRDRAYTDFENTLSPEPYAYETGFAVQWTVADQINGRGNLNFDPTRGPVVAPYVRWGPYPWADGTSPRSDGFTWLCRDVDPVDFIHPSDSGTKKIADHLLAFFKTDPTATPWFLKPPPRQAPTVTISSAPASGPPGTLFRFSATAQDPFAPIVAYQWTFDDGTFSEAQNPAKSFPVAGNYNVHLTVTDAAGNYATRALEVAVDPNPTPTPSPTPTPTPTLTPTPTPTPSPSPSATPDGLLNVSTRGDVGTGDLVLIGGFLIDGNGTKKVLLRALGPSLGASEVGASLADPTLELHDASGATIATNNNWQTTELGGVITSDQVVAIRATGVPPTRPNESALIATLGPGGYTAIVRGFNNSSGVGLTEVYDLAPASAALANLSTRGAVETDNQVLIGGFIVGGENSSRILIRALGPSLADAGVANALADPTLELRDQDGALLQANDDWAETQEAEILATGAPPVNAREAAILRVLAPGNYTAIVAGKDGETGIGLVEVYHLP